MDKKRPKNRINPYNVKSGSDEAGRHFDFEAGREQGRTDTQREIVKNALSENYMDEGYVTVKFFHDTWVEIKLGTWKAEKE